jgi:triosephosphate isomerase
MMDAPQRWLIANWKMHGTRASAANFAFHVNQLLNQAPAWLNIVFCPPFTALEASHTALPGNARLRIGGQNCAKDNEGAFTGGISAPMLKDCGAAYVILGHSERRQYMYETDIQVEAKACTAMAAGLTPIVCVGETLEEYEAGRTAEALTRQCSAFKDLTGNYLVAYEPVWAIGSGRTPTTAEISAAHSLIKSTLGSAKGVLYGGSVKPTNIREILASEGVDGALIGGASLELESMRAMVAATTGNIN